MDPANQPTEAQGNPDRRIWLGFDHVAERVFDRNSRLFHGFGRIACRIDRLSIQILRRTFRLIVETFGLGLGVARNPAETLFHLATQILRRPS